MAVAGVSGKAANAGRRACQAWGVPGLGGACATVRRLSGGRTRRIWARERSAKTLLRVELVREMNELGRGPISLSDARARLHLSLVFTFAWWRVCLRARMQVGAKALRSANFWTQGLSPVCKIRMGMIEEQTAPLGGDDALTDPVWGQQFLLDFNPLGLLDIAVTNEQYLMSEEIGRVRMTVSSIMEGMNIAEGQGLKTWETYFLLLTEQHTSDPYKPGSNRSWFRKGAGLHELTGARPVHRGLAETEHELDAPDRGSRISAMGMYGTRSVRVPRVRGRLYVNFDLVEPHASPHLGVGSFHPAVAKHPAATESAALPRPPAASRTLHQPNAPHPTHPASAPAGAAPAGGGAGTRGRGRQCDGDEDVSCTASAESMAADAGRD